jgi:hypothetical protein
MKPASLFPKLSKKKLREMMTPKQKQFVANLEAEGATFDIVAVKGRPWIQNIVRQPRRNSRGWVDWDYNEDDYEFGLDIFS